MEQNISKMSIIPEHDAGGNNKKKGRDEYDNKYFRFYERMVKKLAACCALSEIAAHAEARIILAAAADSDFSRIMGIMWRENVSAGVIDKAEGILLRRLAGEPLQYIMGEAEFYGRPFKVSNAVLIPRHDTECIVSAVIKCAAAEISRRRAFEKAENAGGVNSSQLPASGAFKILDIGAGSGIIAVSLACELNVNSVKITAADISPAALEIAAANARALGVAGAIEFVVSDVYKGLETHGPFDIIVSNPPYISETEYTTLASEVLKEPAAALIAKDEGYEFYHRIIAGAASYLAPSGGLFLETGRGMSHGVIEIAARHGFGNYAMIYDIEHRDRGLEFWR